MMFESLPSGKTIGKELLSKDAPQDKKDDLDFLIGKNDSGEWVSVYRGLSRILSITPYAAQARIKIDAAEKFKALEPELYGERKTLSDFSEQLDSLISKIRSDRRFARYYENRKEGFFQNELSRKFGINGTRHDAFVILDKEAVIGYADKKEKAKIYSVLQRPYKALQKTISDKNAVRYGENLDQKPIGNELDFLALDRAGNILLIEYKHGNNTAGIYKSPLQIGMYYDLFTKLNRDDLNKAVYEMLDQKKRIGLINASWEKPKTLKQIIPVLIVSEYPPRSSARQKFEEILEISREHFGSTFLYDLQAYNYTSEKGLHDWLTPSN